MSHVTGSHSIPFLYKLKQLDLEGGCQGARAVTTRCWASKRKRSKVKGKVLSFAKIRCVTQMIRGPEPQRPEPRGGIDDTDFIMLEPVAHLTRAE
jgi:hypothetical protein